MWSQNFFKSFVTGTLSNSSNRTIPNDVVLYKQNNLVKQIDFLMDTLESAKLDILYMEKLRMPLTPEENVYFISQIDRINSAVSILLWMQNNIKSKKGFFNRFV
jgi:hypothetical protein